MFIDGICRKLRRVCRRNNLRYFKIHQLRIPQQLALEQAHSIPWDSAEFTKAPTFRPAKAKAKAATRVSRCGERTVGCCINPSFSETSTFQLLPLVPSCLFPGKTGLYSDMFWTPLIAQALAIERKKDSEMARTLGVWQPLWLHIKSYCICFSKTCF